jgi:hypothetical protein
MENEKTIYFYDDKTEVKEHEKYYTVYKVNAADFDIQSAENKARTIAKKHKSNLAGGMFNENCKPYNFDTNYTVIKVPCNTQETEDPRSAMIDFIMDFESGNISQDRLIENFQKMIDSGIVWQLQGFYSRTAKRLIEAGYCHN